jgi:hypothetical protein
MPIITLSFPFELNVSIQANPAATWNIPIGADVAYYVHSTPVSLPGPPHESTTTPHSFEILHPAQLPTAESGIIKIGPVLSVTQWNGVTSSITCDMDQNQFNFYGPPNGQFILFSKDNKANLSSILGYYAEVEFINTSKDKAELFSVGADIFESSK